MRNYPPRNECAPLACLSNKPNPKPALNAKCKVGRESLRGKRRPANYTAQSPSSAQRRSKESFSTFLLRIQQIASKAGTKRQTPTSVETQWVVRRAALQAPPSKLHRRTQYIHNKQDCVNE